MSTILDETSSLIECGPYVINPNSNASNVRMNGVRVRLTRFEIIILLCLVARRGQVVSKDDLAAQLYSDRSTPPQSNGLEVFIRRVRDKIDPQGDIKPIETVRGLGYRFKADWGNTNAVAA